MAVLQELAVGQIPQERMTELAQSLGGIERHALDWYRTSEEAKEKTDEVAVVDQGLPEEQRKETLYQLF